MDIRCAIGGAPKIKSIAYGNGKYVLITSVGVIYHSTDAINWTKVTLPDASDLYDVYGSISNVCFGNGKFLAYTHASLYSSIDGATWTSVPTNGYRIGRISYANGRWWGSGQYDTISMQSIDGVTWGPYGFWPSYPSWTRGVPSNVVWNGSQYWSVQPEGFLYKRNNPGDWILVTYPGRPSCPIVRKGNYLAFGNQQSQVAYSRNNGVTWEYFVLPSSDGPINHVTLL